MKCAAYVMNVVKQVIEKEMGYYSLKACDDMSVSHFGCIEHSLHLELLGHS